jgi:hypothetical protein
MPGVVDLSDLVAESDGVARIVLEPVQAMLLKIALQMARDDDQTRRRRQLDRIMALRSADQTVSAKTKLAGCLVSQVTQVWAMHRENKMRKSRGRGNPIRAFSRVRKTKYAFVARASRCAHG